MNEYISKERAQSVIRTVWSEGDAGLLDYQAAIEDEPPADVKPVVRGEWLPKWGAFKGVNAVENYFRCSVCNAPEPVKKNFCPNCGAKNSTAIQG